MDGARLEEMRESLAEHHTTGLLVIRNDTIVCEWYQEGYGADKPHYTASMAKAIVGGVSLAVAISDGLIALDDPAARFVPHGETDPRKSKITIRHLGSHTSGIEDAEADDLPHDKLTGWKGDFWKRLDPPRDPFTLSRDAAPVLFEPGEKMQYSNPGIAMLTYCVTAALRDTPHHGCSHAPAGACDAAYRRGGCRVVRRLWQDLHRRRFAFGRILGRRRLYGSGGGTCGATHAPRGQLGRQTTHPSPRR